MAETLVTTYEGVEIFVNGEGLFLARPEGKKDPITAQALYSLRHEVKAYVKTREDAKGRGKIKNLHVPARLWRNGLKATTFEGFIHDASSSYSPRWNIEFKGFSTSMIADTVANTVRVLKKGADVDALEELRLKAKIAKEVYEDSIQLNTTKVSIKMPYISRDSTERYAVLHRTAEQITNGLNEAQA